MALVIILIMFKILMVWNCVDLADGKDRYIVGQAMPKALLGANIGFRYKQFDIQVQMNGAFGHKIYNGTSLSYMNMSQFPTYNVLAEAPSEKHQRPNRGNRLLVGER